MALKIITEPDPILRQKTKEIALADLTTPKMRDLIQDMIDTMETKDGVGLAAPQIGESIRLCVISEKHNPLKKGKKLILFNPLWEKMSVLKAWDEEGCLSTPEIYGKVKRYRKIHVKALDENGQPVEFMTEDFPARVIQHEVDHLDGILFIDKAKDLHRIQKEL